MEVRSSLSCATVRPRYSVSSTAVELRNSSVSSATEASLFAMWLLNFVDALRCDVHRTRPPGRDPAPLTKKAPAQAHGAGEPGEFRMSNFTHLRGHLLESKTSIVTHV